MASPMALQLCSTIPSPSLSSPQRRCSRPGHTTQDLQRQLNRRRLTAAAALTTAFLVKEAFSNSNNASSFEFRFTVPDQTLEEADAGVKVHARDLLQIKDFIDSKSWKEAQLALRQRSPYLKQDLYTIIQAKPGSQRLQLRKLYSNLFNNVSRLDYAARDRDARVVQECYMNIVTTLDEIFSII
ncbi:psbQ-like protein 3, chloroplastic [Elaeis guineensis]|uniref:PsbQ-like protein 3, chloroplastic n=1 Tax=Elaeis guineensis var. tenera TaxID=51953 RepID=A0A6I9RWZ6_ELAGV|nr:psbQ-like protein 3, chloroplastic [Elaeis guineensis]